MLTAKASSNAESRSAAQQVHMDMRELRVVQMKKSQSSFWARKKRIAATAIAGACVMGVLLAVAILTPKLIQSQSTGSPAQSTAAGTSTTTTTTTTVTTVTTTVTSTIPPTCFTCTVDYTITTNPSQSGKIDCYTYCHTGGFDCYVDSNSVFRKCIASYYGYSFNPTTPAGRRRRGTSNSPTINLQNSGFCAEDQRYHCCCTPPRSNTG